jgi:hypothetical protein
LLNAVIPQTSSSSSAAGGMHAHEQKDDDDMLRRQLEGLLEQRERPLGQLALDCFKALLAAKHATSNPSSEGLARYEPRMFCIWDGKQKTETRGALVAACASCRDLAAFMITDLGEYSMKKVPEHLTAAYLHQTNPHAAQAAVSREQALFAEMLSTVQGIQATAYLQLGGLRDRVARAEYLASTDNLRYRWDCPSCKKSIMVTAAEMEQHIGTCCQQKAQEREAKRDAQQKKRPKLGTAVR